MTKQQAIETYLLCGKSITKDKARMLFNSWRLAVCVNRMRNKHWDVKADLVGPTKHARYYLPASEIRRIRKSPDVRA